MKASVKLSAISWSEDSSEEVSPGQPGYKEITLLWQWKEYGLAADS